MSIQQGVWGDVWFWEGDFMPICISGTVRPVSREIRIHEIATLSDAVGADGAFFRQVNTPLVATVRSDADGFFQAALEPGSYSLFAVEDSLLYANRFSGDGDGSFYIFPVNVTADGVTPVQFDIDYQASE